MFCVVNSSKLMSATMTVPPARERQEYTCCVKSVTLFLRLLYKSLLHNALAHSAGFIDHVVCRIKQRSAGREKSRFSPGIGMSSRLLRRKRAISRSFFLSLLKGFNFGFFSIRENTGCRYKTGTKQNMIAFEKGWRYNISHNVFTLLWRCFNLFFRQNTGCTYKT